MNIFKSIFIFLLYLYLKWIEIFRYLFVHISIIERKKTIIVHLVMTRNIIIN